MNRDEVKIPMTEESQVGEVEKFKIQTGERVKIPDEFLEEHDLEQGSKVAVVCEEDGIKIIEWTLDNLQDL